MAGGEGEGRTGHRVQGERHNARRVSPPKPLTLNSKRKTYVGGVAGGAGIAGGAGAHMATATQKEQVAEQHSPQHASPSFCCAGGGARAPAAAAPLPPSLCVEKQYMRVFNSVFNRFPNTKTLKQRGASKPSPSFPSLPPSAPRKLTPAASSQRESRPRGFAAQAPRGLRSPAPLSLQTVRPRSGSLPLPLSRYFGATILVRCRLIYLYYLARRTGTLRMHVMMHVVTHVLMQAGK